MQDWLHALLCSVYTHTYTHTHTHTRTYAHTYIHTHTHTLCIQLLQIRERGLYPQLNSTVVTPPPFSLDLLPLLICVYAHVCVRVCIYACMYLCVYKCRKCMCVCMYVCVCVCMCLYVTYSCVFNSLRALVPCLFPQPLPLL